MMQPASRQAFVEVEPDVRLAIVADEENGQPAVIFSHSIGATAGMWDEVVARLSGRIRAIRYDARGHGGSSLSRHPLTVERLGSDIAAILHSLRVDRAAVCGLSLGGITALAFAAAHPGRVDGLVLANTAASFPPPSLWEERASTVRKAGMEPLREATLERWFTPAFRDRCPERVAEIAATFIATPREGYAGGCEALAVADLAPRLADIRCPTLVVCGAHDPSTPPARGAELVAGISGATMVTLNAAHISAIEAADDFAEALDAFLMRLRNRSRQEERRR
jgi:3-oxoadipate enol-lactonase